ncbi:hypothetical protein BDV24DRAFT_171510 [Aspergillus arachidicola]|uniref:Nudix hydrolase domain-containing protein n=1 Tax=Aspergillus arachidicola TaxID=656916 RepID=A0A5N6XQP5_9EURO|nr:hypothetical protein BDV24DRAFT_171510 [Aspergillus arachidicola]
MFSQFSQVRPGVSVFVFNREGRFLMGLRKGSHGDGTLGLPGGHIHFEESLEECAIREVKEETGLEITNVEFLTVTNDIFKKEKKHYTTNVLAAKLHGNKREPEICEPDKCDSWQWFSWEEVNIMCQEEGKLFLPMENLFRQRQELHPFEAYEEILRKANKAV